jgi:hypothetical protein
MSSCDREWCGTLELVQFLLFFGDGLGLVSHTIAQPVPIFFSDGQGSNELRYASGYDMEIIGVRDR